MNHRHGIFNGNGLTSAGLHIQFRAAKAGENEGLFTHQQVRTVQLGANVHAQIQLTHRREAVFVIGHRHRKVAAEADKRSGTTVNHGLGCLHCVMAMVRGRLKAKHLLKTVQKCRGWFLAYPDGTVS